MARGTHTIDGETVDIPEITWACSCPAGKQQLDGRQLERSFALTPHFLFHHYIYIWWDCIGNLIAKGNVSRCVAVLLCYLSIIKLSKLPTPITS
jgi:hypothetical protein